MSERITVDFFGVVTACVLALIDKFTLNGAGRCFITCGVTLKSVTGCRKCHGLGNVAAFRNGALNDRCAVSCAGGRGGYLCISMLCLRNFNLKGCHCSGFYAVFTAGAGIKHGADFIAGSGLLDRTGIPLMTDGRNLAGF